MLPTTPTIGRYNAEGLHSSTCSLQGYPGPGGYSSANFNDASMGRRVGNYSSSSLGAASYLPNSSSTYGGHSSSSSSSFQPTQRSASGIYTDPYNYCIPSTIEFTHFRMGFMGPTTMGHSPVGAGGINFPLSLPNQQTPTTHFHNNLTIAAGFASSSSSTSKPLAVYGHRGERPHYALAGAATMQPGPQTPLLSHIGAWSTTEQGMIATHPQVLTTAPNRADIANQPLDISRLHGARKSAAKLYSCETCGKQYCRKGTLKSHMREHSGVERPFNCQLCGKTFSQQANLIAHRRIHTGEKPFRCPVCHRPFSQSSSLVTHKRTHTGERPYPCAECDKAFADSSTLTKHLRTHTGQKPYICSVCRMRFSQSGNLHRHMKTHVQNSKSSYR